MNRKSRTASTFAISFIIAFFIVGYIKNTTFVTICWTKEATIWSKFKEYYIRTFSDNIIPAFVIAIIATIIINLFNRKKRRL